MIEVEKKFYIDDETIARLKKLGKVVSEKKLVDDYWDQPDFWVTKADCWLRNRNGNWELKVGKQDKLNTTVNLDVYEEIEDPKTIAKFLKIDYRAGDDFEKTLKDNGYFIFCPIVKTRLKLKIEDFQLDIDNFAGQGTDYMEIELMVSDQSEVESATQKITDFADRLGIMPRSKPYGQVVECIKQSYPELFLDLIKIGLVQD